MFEVEIKARCFDKNSFIEKIISAGAIHVETREEVDMYFNHPQRNFAETDEALRLRRVGSKTFLTYKGPKVSAKSKARLEEETCVENFDSMQKILYMVGFVECNKVAKVREVYTFDKIEICVDSIEELGDFIELETISEHTEETEEYLLNIANSFGISEFIRKSYLEMVLEKRLGGLV